MSNYRAFIKKDIELFTVVVKTDNTSTGSTADDEFKFENALGNYDVIARNESTNNIQIFSNLSGAAIMKFSEGAGTYELKIKLNTQTNCSRNTNIERVLNFH